MARHGTSFKGSRSQHITITFRSIRKAWFLTMHRNKGIKRPRVQTVQVTGTMKAIIDSNFDQMPHQMRGIGNGRVDILKYMPTRNNWKCVQVDANEVIQNLCLCLLLFRLDHFCSHWLSITCLHSSGYLPILLNLERSPNGDIQSQFPRMCVPIVVSLFGEVLQCLRFCRLLMM